jgi:flagellar biosynthesis protein FlhG
VPEEQAVKNPVADQADGLRRLMANSPGRRVAFVGGTPAVGVSSVTLNLATALTRMGHDVRLLTEGDVAHPFLPRQGQLVLVDTRLDKHGMLPSMAAGADDVVVLLRPQAESITAAYACIKRLHQVHGLSKIRVLLNHTADAGEARRIFLNLTAVAGRYLALSLEFAGCISADLQWARASWLNMSVVDAFPNSPAAVDVGRLAWDLLRWPSPTLNHAMTRPPVGGASVLRGRDVSLATVVA